MIKTLIIILTICMASTAASALPQDSLDTEEVPLSLQLDGLDRPAELIAAGSLGPGVFGNFADCNIHMQPALVVEAQQWLLGDVDRNRVGFALGRQQLYLLAGVVGGNGEAALGRAYLGHQASALDLQGQDGGGKLKSKVHIHTGS